MNYVFSEAKNHILQGRRYLRGREELVYTAIFIVVLAAVFPALLMCLASHTIVAFIKLMTNPTFKYTIVGLPFVVVYEALIVNTMYVGLFSIYIKPDTKIKDVFSGFTKGNYFNKAIALIVYEAAFIPMILFVKLFDVISVFALPFVVVSVICICSLSLVSFILADDPTIPFYRAIQMSWKATDGYKLTIFMINLICCLPVVIYTLIYSVFSELLFDYDVNIFIHLFVMIGLMRSTYALALLRVMARMFNDAAIASVYKDARNNYKEDI